MKLQPIIYTTDTDSTVEWWSRVLGSGPTYRSDVWTSFQVGDAALAVHRVDEPLEGGSVALSLIATEPLEDVIASLGGDVDIERGIQDETFGRSLLLKDPDGQLVQVNEHD